MAKLACAAWGFRGYTPAEYFDAAGRLGLRFVEVSLDRGQSRHLSPAMSEIALQRVVTQATNAGVRVVAVAGSSDFTLSSEAARTMQVDAARRQVEICAAIGAKVLRLYAGWADARHAGDEVFSWARGCLLAVAQTAQGCGVTIAIENHGGITSTAAKCLRLLRDMPRCVGLAYDPANFLQYDEDPLAALHVLAPYIVYTHWKDARPVSGVLECCAMGEGVISWQPIVTELARSYDGYWAIEYEEPSDVVRGTRVCMECLEVALLRSPAGGAE